MRFCVSAASTAAFALRVNIASSLVAATDAVMGRTLDGMPACETPQRAIHGIGLAVYDAIELQPWVGAQLSRAPWEAAMLQIFERIGRQVQVLEARAEAQFTSASALLGYIVGVSIQNAANAARVLDPPVDRSEFLEVVSARWQALDANTYPFIRNVVVARLAEHDDRAEFSAGLELILAGISASQAKRV